MDEKLVKIKDIFVNLTNKKVKTISKFNNGFTNQCYLINDAYVLKTPSEYIQPFIDYNNESYILNCLKDNKNVVSVYLENIENKILIMKYIHQAKPYTDTLDKNQIINVCKAIKKIHRINDENIKKFDMFERLETYKKNSKEKLDGRYERKIINRIKKSIENEQLVLCHNDLVQNNMLFKFNDVVLIDFEFASLNYIYFDLASLISENNLNDAQKELVLKAYFGYKLNKSKTKKVNNFIKFLDIFWFYWADMMYQNRKLPCYLDIKKDKLRRIKLDIDN